MTAEPRDELSHLAADGSARMVDVSGKDVTIRTARAEARVSLRAATRSRIEAGKLPKGAVFEVARVAAIQAAKRTADLVPMCHPLALDNVEVAFEWLDGESTESARLRITTTVKVTAKTGVEMEALTAASVAALTVYDMVKAVDREAVIEAIRLLEKTGGKSDFRA